MNLKTPVSNFNEIQQVLFKLLYKQGFILGSQNSESKKTIDSVQMIHLVHYIVSPDADEKWSGSTGSESIVE